MGKKILAVIAGYLSMAITVFVSFTVLYLILGPEGSFVPQSYQVSLTWIFSSIFLSLFAAIIGGFVCQLIAKNRNTSLVLAGIVFILGIAAAVPTLTTPSEYAHQPREGSVGNMDAMQRAQQPPFILILNPIISAIGVYFGSRLKSEKKV